VRRVRWTGPAIGQLTAIVNHIRQDNPEAARKVAQGIFKSVERLKIFPSMGRPGEKEGTRELVSSVYVIVYRLREDVAEILSIWHGAQDWQ
jgi:toxin ParE1/3/4